MPEPISASAAASAAAAQVAKAALNTLGKKLAKGLSNLTTTAVDQIAVSFRLGFEAYLKTSYHQCRFLKTIINPSEPLEVMRNYVHVTLTCGDKPCSDDGLVADVDKLKAIVVTGLAGSGKSMFMRYLTVWNFENIRETIPLFIELRRLNGLTEKDLLVFIRVTCTSRMSVITENQFYMSLRAGVFLLVLDGFDELNHDAREGIQRQIFDIRRDFPETSIVVSSRPDGRFSAWNEFRVYKVNDLSKEQTINLIENLPYDNGVKKRFIREVSDRLYASHRSFLSSPLLATIMLLTYEGFAEIPNKMHSFDGQAFDTLFQKHDAQKEQFQRQTHSGLPLEDFKECFAAFCAMSYLKERYSFSEESLIETADLAINYVMKNKGKQTEAGVRSRSKKGNLSKGVTPSQFVSDLRESVCMLQHDGLEISFVHRSFQEYFAAKFVTTLHGEKVAKILDRYCLRAVDSVIIMLGDMYRDPLEQEWVLPTIVRLEKVLSPRGASKSTAAILRKFIDEIAIQRLGRRIMIHVFHYNIELFGPLETISRLYPEHLGSFAMIRHLGSRTVADINVRLMQKKIRG